MYKVNRPLRIVETDNNLFLLSIPRTGMRFEINDYVADFLQLLQMRESFDLSVIEEFAGLRHICNTEDYRALAGQMIEMKVLIEE